MQSHSSNRQAFTLVSQSCRDHSGIAAQEERGICRYISPTASGMQAQKLESRIAAEAAGRLAPGKARPEEEYLLARLVADAERKEIARLQKEVRDMKLSRWYVYPVQYCTPVVRQDT